MRTHLFPLLGAGLAALAIRLLTIPDPLAADGPRRLGFTAATFAEQRAAEERLATELSGQRISAAHRQLTRRPHMAGSEGGREVATFIRGALEQAGLHAAIVEYHAYLSTPKSVRVELLAPSRRTVSLLEPASPRDPDTGHPDLGPGFIAYSGSGTANGPVVYVNYGLPGDYARLAAAGVDVRGAVVLARYARSHRAVKVHTAQEAGASGIVLFSDPADDGYGRGDVWPDGPWRPTFLLQRGNAKFSWFWHGDPLTPGVGATADAPAMDPADAPTLPRIPAVVIAATDAEKILRQLRGAPALAGFQGGLPFTYHAGPGPARIRLDVRMDAGRRVIRNVIGRIEGVQEPDRWVMLGTHHDAWTFGGIDPSTATSTLLEVARGLADLKRSGWQPARSVVFTFWDAEEFGLIGSTEFAEDRERELREKAVCYINTDMYMEGALEAGGVPSLRDFVIEVTRDLPEGAQGGQTLYDAWRANEWNRQSPERRRRGQEGFEVELKALGSGADFVPFQDYLGLPTLSLEFLFPGGWGYGTYHSNYDTRYFAERHADPQWRRGPQLARLLGTTAMRLAGADVLPFRHSHYAARLREYVDAAEAWGVDEEGRRRIDVDVSSLRAQLTRVADRSAALEKRLDEALAAGRVSRPQAREVNDLLMRMEQTLIDDTIPVRERWYRHVVYGWNIYSLYDGQPLPHLADAIRRRDPAMVARERERIGRAFDRMLAGLERANASAAAW
jgi:N-acetylated-alpha-linked acidic dipeptidase